LSKAARSTRRRIRITIFPGVREMRRAPCLPAEWKAFKAIPLVDDRRSHSVEVVIRMDGGVP